MTRIRARDVNSNLGSVVSATDAGNGQAHLIIREEVSLQIAFAVLGHVRQ